MPTLRKSPSLWALVVLATLFVAATAGAWAWFHIQPPQVGIQLEFTPRTTLPQAKFQAIPIGEQAMEILANTNLLNGKFTFDNQRVFTVFFGDWRARSAREMNVVQHTPDICWIGAGWNVIDLKLPSQVELNLNGQRIPFVCRAFRAPRGNHEELTMWCTLVGGQVFDEGERFSAEEDISVDKTVRQHTSARRRAYEQFLRAIQHRVASSGSKQFVRFSTAIRGEPASSLQQLIEFGERWIELKQIKSTHTE